MKAEDKKLLAVVSIILIATSLILLAAPDISNTQSATKQETEQKTKQEEKNVSQKNQPLVPAPKLMPMPFGQTNFFNGQQSTTPASKEQLEAQRKMFAEMLKNAVSASQNAKQASPTQTQVDQEKVKNQLLEAFQKSAQKQTDGENLVEKK